MPRLRFALPTRLYELPLRQKLHRVAAAGVQGVQFDLRHEVQGSNFTDTGRRQLRHLLAELTLQPAPALFPLRRSLTDQEGLEERVAAVGAALRFAAELQIPGVIVRPGPLPLSGDAADDKATASARLMTEVLDDLARIGNHVGCTLIVSTGREAPAELRAVLATVTAGPTSANIDAGGLAMAGRDPTEAVRLLHEQLGHVRLRDGQRDADGPGIETAVGRGEVAWDEFLATLVEAGYTGFLTADRTAGSDPAGDAERALTYMRNVMPF